MRDRYNNQDEDRPYRAARRYGEDYNRENYNRSERGYGRRDREDERGLLDRAGDEVRSWFGDEEAERRRRMDERRYGNEGDMRDRSYDRSYKRRGDTDRYGRENYYTRERGYGDRGGERGFFERAGDEMSSWFGDEDAARRRRFDEARDNRGAESTSGRSRLGGDEYTAGRGEHSEERFGTGQTGSPRTFTYTEFWLIPGPETGRGPRNYRRADEHINEDVCERLTQHGRINARDIEVKVENGEVILTGSVENREAKRMAEDVAESVSGVEEVHNQLRVKQESFEAIGESGTKDTAATAATTINETASSRQAETATTTGRESSKAKLA